VRQRQRASPHTMGDQPPTPARYEAYLLRSCFSTYTFDELSLRTFVITCNRVYMYAGRSHRHPIEMDCDEPIASA